jgi:hypothetical protein
MLIPLTYLLPYKASAGEDFAELAAYLLGVAEVVDQVIVVDGSGDELLAAHKKELPGITVVAPAIVTPMGKVGNVLTGLERAHHDLVVIADDDVRYEPHQLERILSLFEHADVVRPQNYFDPLPWHARVDTARILLNRMTGGDWPGTLGVRRSKVMPGGYAGDALFENLELVRTVVARGGRETLALDLIVRRVPPSTAHFRGQQVRQAYDEVARPARLATMCAIAPASLYLAFVAPALLAGAAVASVVLAEAGRRRCGGRVYFPASSVFLAPVWLVWRSLCSWAALGAWLRGGARYRGTRLRRSATSMRELRHQASVVYGSEELGSSA